eukprot:363626-Chlamydomonas_euryale.AAC.3
MPVPWPQASCSDGRKPAAGCARRRSCHACLLALGRSEVIAYTSEIEVVAYTSEIIAYTSEVSAYTSEIVACISEIVPRTSEIVAYKFETYLRPSPLDGYRWF